jgi:hypothetical protein
MLTIGPADTDPDSCDVDFPSGRSIVAGSTFEAAVSPFDEFKNPTSHPDDSFEAKLGEDNSFEMMAMEGNSYQYARAMTIAGT